MISCSQQHKSQISIIDEYVPDEYEYDDVCSEYESDDDKFITINQGIYTGRRIFICCQNPLNVNLFIHLYMYLCI